MPNSLTEIKNRLEYITTTLNQKNLTPPEKTPLLIEYWSLILNHSSDLPPESLPVWAKPITALVQPFELSVRSIEDGFAHAEEIFLLQDIIETRLLDYSRIRVSPNLKLIVQTTNTVTEAYGAGSADYFSIDIEVWQSGHTKPILRKHEDGGYDNDGTHGFRFADFSKDSQHLLFHYHGQSRVTEIAIPQA